MARTPFHAKSPPCNEQTDPLLIQTQTLTLRKFVPEDARKLFHMSQEEILRTWLPNQVYRDEKHAASVLESLISQYRAPANPRLGGYVLGVELRTTGDLIGHVGFSPFHGAVEVGFAIEQVHQRKGVASEAVRAASDWASTAFSLEAILGIAAAQNFASQAVLLRAGYSWQKAEVTRFQGVEQPVVFFAFTGHGQAQ